MCDCNCGCEWCDDDHIEYEDPYEILDKIGEGSFLTPMGFRMDYEVFNTRHKETGEMGKKVIYGCTIKIKGTPE